MFKFIFGAAVGFVGGMAFVGNGLLKTYERDGNLDVVTAQARLVASQRSAPRQTPQAGEKNHQAGDASLASIEAYFNKILSEEGFN